MLCTEALWFHFSTLKAISSGDLLRPLGKVCGEVVIDLAAERRGGNLRGFRCGGIQSDNEFPLSSRFGAATIQAHFRACCDRLQCLLIGNPKGDLYAIFSRHLLPPFRPI